jgi:hypothetical protein
VGIGLFLFGLLLETPGSAQVAPEEFRESIKIQVGKHLKLLIGMSETQRRRVITQRMVFNANQRRDFWPLYYAYRAAMSKVEIKRFEIIDEYSGAYVSKTLTDERAISLLKNFLSMQKERVRIKEYYVAEFQKILTPKQVLRFYQLDNKLEVTEKAILARDVPLVN